EVAAMSEVAGRAEQAIAPVLADAGLELVDVIFTGGNLRVFVDRAGGVDLDTISEVSARLSRALDHDDPVPGSYTLEVSSPGLERPLRTPDQFRRFVGATVSVKTRPEVDGPRREQGRLEAADEDGIVVVPTAGPGQGTPRRLAYSEIDRARTVFEWGPSPKPGKGPRKQEAATAGSTPRPGGKS
ncbi:MAG TPA: ribosome maturation factor RimP, partial [Acidimicrobiales bacterium]|nr:ribosome maturation factor RimP [Acidimicrobiales bacterium]